MQVIVLRARIAQLEAELAAEQAKTARVNRAWLALCQRLREQRELMRHALETELSKQRLARKHRIQLDIPFKRSVKSRLAGGFRMSGKKRKH